MAISRRDMMAPFIANDGTMAPSQEPCAKARIDRTDQPAWPL